MKLKFVNGLPKKKQVNTIKGIVVTGLITSTMITGDISVTAFASGVDLPVGIALSGISLLLFLATVITQKAFKTFTLKQEKHYSIKLLAQSKLDSIANIISQAMQGGDISPTEFHKLLPKRWKNIANLRLISGTKPGPR